MIQDLIFWQGLLEPVLVPFGMVPSSLETMMSYRKLDGNAGLALPV